MPGARRVAILAYDGLSLLEFAVACDVFGDRRPGHGLRAVSGLRLRRAPRRGDRRAAALRLRVPYGARHGRPGRRRSSSRRATTRAAFRRRCCARSARAHARGARIISLCTGAAVLAEAGLLDGRRATTHWAECEAMARRFPSVTIDPGVLYVDDGDILTSAGSAGEHRPVPARRPPGSRAPRWPRGSPASSSSRPTATGVRRSTSRRRCPQPADTDLFAETMAWVQAHLDEPVTVDDLAQRSAMSRRTFARRFAASTGTTPYQWLLQAAAAARPATARDHRSVRRRGRDPQRLSERR